MRPSGDGRRALRFSSRGARGLCGLGRFVCGTRSSLGQAFIQHAGKARDSHFARTGLQQRLDACVTGGATSQHIIDEDDGTPGNLVASAQVNCDCIGQRALASLLAEPTQRGCRLCPHERIKDQFRSFRDRQFPRQQGGLVIPASPQPPTMQRDRNNDRILLQFTQPTGHQASHHACERYAAAVLETQDQLPRSIVVERRSGNPCMAWRMCEAGGTDCWLVKFLSRLRRQWALALGA